MIDELEDGEIRVVVKGKGKPEKAKKIEIETAKNEL